MRRGFTLLEVLVAMSILIVIVAVVYASFASVTDTISVARVRTEEMRLRQFLERSLRTNLTSVYVDRGYEQQIFQFVGTNDENSVGPRDSLRFVSTNALMGGSALPGDFNEVRYEVFGGEEGKMRLGADKQRQEERELTDLTPEQAKLEATETPLLASNAQAIDAETGNIDVTQTNTNTTNQNVPIYEAPSWTVPVRTVDFTYYDGTQWVDEWDSQMMGSLPWCVRVRVNFARTEEEIRAEEDRNLNIIDNPDFEIVVPIPLSLGQVTDGRTQAQAEEQAAGAEDQAGAATQAVPPTEDESVPASTSNAAGATTSTKPSTGIGRSGRSGILGRGSSIFSRGSPSRAGGRGN